MMDRLEVYSRQCAEFGPNENKVRASLRDRLAGKLYAINFEGSGQGCNAEYTFAALFNGARQGWGTPGFGVTFGKAEAEWGWPLAWEALRDAGLITFTVTERDSPGLVGGRSFDVNWHVTDLGWAVRNDDLAWDRELWEAREKDRLAERDPDTGGA